MEIKIKNVLSLQLEDEDVNDFVDVFGTLKNAIHSQNKKVGFKKNGSVTIELSENSLEFIETICNDAGILSENEIQLMKEQEQENDNK